MKQRRPHLDTSKHVFINCPFDTAYRDIFEAVVFAVHDCGFFARCALEQQDSGQVRIEKILGLIEQCRFGIHDISRTEVDSRTRLPRFNMPLELGIFLGAKRFGNRTQQAKVCLVLDKERYRYQKFCSDIAGHDPEAHQKRSDRVIGIIRNWLQSHAETRIPGERIILARYRTFRRTLPRVCEKSGLDRARLTFHDLVRCITNWLIEAGKYQTAYGLARRGGPGRPGRRSINPSSAPRKTGTRSRASRKSSSRS